MADETPHAIAVPDALPVLPAHDTVLFPDMAAAIVVVNPKLVELVDEALKSNLFVAAVAQKASGGVTRPEDLYSVGTMGALHELSRSETSIRLAIQGISRVRVRDFVRTTPYTVARVEAHPEVDQDGLVFDALVRTAKELFGTYVRITPTLPDDLAIATERMTSARPLASVIVSALDLPLEERQALLELDLVSLRLERLINALQHEIAVKNLMHRITTETAEEISKAQRDQILRKQMETIQRELGEGSSERADTSALREKLTSLPLPAETKKEAMHELERLERTPEASPEHSMIATYLDWIIRMPWGKLTSAPIDIEEARRVLDRDHYDLEKVKERILDYLAVTELRRTRMKDDPNGPPAPGDPPARMVRTEPILCFLGPPGVGKTSLGQSIARALKRSFVRQSLGGIHDEAEIRGHRRTYIGAMPGRIVQALVRAGAADPVLMLDEIDKLSAGFQGDPSAALLELLDPAQNSAFVDTYLAVPFDLSKVLFICTANTTDTIPAPLLDRMEILRLAGYTEREKLHIALHHLVPNQREASGLCENEVVLPEETITEVIRGYTREAGVRNLEREIGTLFRKAARQITEKVPAPIHIGPQALHEFLGAAKHFDNAAEVIDRSGVATGLSWTPAGGEVLFVEATMLPSSKERLILTGMMGNVMRESAEAALTYLRANAARFGINPREIGRRRAVHVHVPAGAIPKDGPSAGITILVALASHALGTPVRPDMAMTGEITLRGKVLPVGGIKEKVLAANRAGLHTIALPRKNERDLEEVPEEVRTSSRFILIDNVDEALFEALGVPRRDENYRIEIASLPH
jgi:ATP-dependent Lon protease